MAAKGAAPQAAYTAPPESAASMYGDSNGLSPGLDLKSAVEKSDQISVETRIDSSTYFMWAFPKQRAVAEGAGAESWRTAAAAAGFDSEGAAGVVGVAASRRRLG